MKILITRGGGTGPMIPRQRIRYEYCANSGKGNLKDKKEAHFDCIYRSLFLSFRKKLILTVYTEASFYLLERGFFYVKIKGGRTMGATGVASQRKTIEESIERNKEKYIETSHDIHANPEIGNQEFYASRTLSLLLGSAGFQLQHNIVWT